MIDWEDHGWEEGGLLGMWSESENIMHACRWIVRHDRNSRVKKTEYRVFSLCNHSLKKDDNLHTTWKLFPKTGYKEILPCEICKSLMTK